MSQPSLHLITCRDACAFGPARDHHDRLLRVDTDPEVLLELFDIAVTWHELDWSAGAVVPPAEWPTFAARHRWVDEDRAVRAFALAADIVERGRRRPVRHRRTLLDA
ncbi:hypothetical protein [Pseudonocardia thermophila]|nr:hypothetical protein [Pseudonocardia thermophila]